MRSLATAFPALLLPCLLIAQSRPTEKPVAKVKPAWEWTLDERIAKRLDPVLIRERALANEKDLVERGGFKPEEVIPVRFTIEGRRDPALFMPSELFNSILDGVSPTDAEHAGKARQRYRLKITEFGWDEEVFWQTVRDAGAEYWKMTDERLALEEAALTQSLTLTERRALNIAAEALNVPGCRLRLGALQTVRQRLGTEIFNRFLYETIAPRISISSDIPFANEEWRLRYIEGGCR